MLNRQHKDGDLCDLVTGKRANYAARGAVVKENAHQSKRMRWKGAGTSKLRAANSNTARTCSRVT